MSSGSSCLGKNLANMFFEAKDGYNNKGGGETAPFPPFCSCFTFAPLSCFMFSLFHVRVQPAVFCGSLFCNSFGSFEPSCCRSVSGQLRFRGRVSRKEVGLCKLHTIFLSLAQLPVCRCSFLSRLLDNSRANYRRGGLTGREAWGSSPRKF